MNPRIRRIAALVLSAVLVISAIAAFLPSDTRSRKGLDIQGGLSVVLAARETAGEPVTTADMDRAVLIVQNRVNNLGASEATVQKQGTDAILVQIPGIQDADAALATLGSTGKLEFSDLNTFTETETVAALIRGERNVSVTPGAYTAALDGTVVKSARVQQDRMTGEYGVALELDASGVDTFAELTSRLAPTRGQIAIILDGTVQSAPVVQTAIRDGRVAIQGSFTLDEAKNLAAILEAGSLPVALTFSEARIVGPTLGSESLQKGVYAALAGLAVVGLGFVLFYRGLGLVAVAAMAVLALLNLGVLAAMSHFGAFALTLPGVAGIVLTIGVAADSSILVLARLREEGAQGRSVKAAALTGVRHGIQTSIDADLVTLVSAFALFFLAIGPVKGFGLTLIIGIVLDILVMLIFKAPLVRLLADGVLPAHPAFWGLPEPAPASRGVVARGGGAR